MDISGDWRISNNPMARVFGNPMVFDCSHLEGAVLAAIYTTTEASDNWDTLDGRARERWQLKLFKAGTKVILSSEFSNECGGKVRGFVLVVEMARQLVWVKPCFAVGAYEDSVPGVDEKAKVDVCDEVRVCLEWDRSDFGKGINVYDPPLLGIFLVGEIIGVISILVVLIIRRRWFVLNWREGGGRVVIGIVVGRIAVHMEISGRLIAR